MATPAPSTTDETHAAAITTSPGTSTTTTTTTASATSTRPRKRLDPFPVTNKDNFRIYHEGPIHPIERHYVQKSSIYMTSSDIPVERKIVNEPKPQVTLRYLTVRGKQYSLQSAQKAANSAKKRKLTATNGSKLST